MNEETVKSFARRGFTLIEQLAALALSSLFMLAAFGVLAALARDRQRDQRTPAVNVSFARAAEAIQRDLTDARRVRIGDNEFTLCGFNSLDANTLAPDHRPVRVIYRIERDEGSSRLVRRQESLDVLSTRNVWSELVCQNVVRLELIPLGVVAAENGRPIADIFSPRDGREIPGTLELKLTPADSGNAPLDRMLLLR